MNDQLQAQLADYLKAILTTAQAGASFVKDQAPLVVQEKIAYGRAYETLWIVVFVIAFGVGLRLALKGLALVPAFENASRGHETAIGIQMFPRLICGALLTFWGFAGIGFNLQVVLQVWFAPRLYILEWALSLVKK